ncbi:hypothetical protein G7Z17_g3184 [Cylindrodendrum hubeiense]|uniref:Gylcosyl hydrolase 115 C-terminal domain-containing protein n=1 Tax=Cylindrodendrum hubeiense TaxID=595255 RepID=A0A9P5LB07_9HYPO|nr:hypothetical protein G7Z17_g3184 [Cylindrodendrum hubeiense]
MFEEKFVEFSPPSPDGATNVVGATILVDEADFTGVKIAASNLSLDFERVTKKGPNPVRIGGEYKAVGDSKVAIIVGCIESSPLLQRLEKEGKVNFSAIRGKWESFTTAVIDSPLTGEFDTALVIAGSDKRGAIFGIYTLSEQIGVSPWYWWADVPPKFHHTIYASLKTTNHGEPSIKYRGIFLNDEAPSMTDWVLEKFGKYNSEFYKKVFELLLRLKANFMWPAMWPGYPNPGANFFVDDMENQRVADEYGIVMSTSHHEPMQRLTNEWFLENEDGSWNWERNQEKMTEFFHEGAERAKGYESYFTIGLRGEYDRKIKGSDPAATISDVIQSQRNIISNVYGSKDKIPQLFAMYRDIEQLYDTGRIDIPDDVTLLFQDDNNGTIRRLPNKKEASRKGGSGGRAWHQLQHAYNSNVRQIWLFNVGDLKPLETPITWAMSLAWNVNKFTTNNLRDFLCEMASRDFGPELSNEIGGVYHEYNRLVSMRKHELVEPDTFSLLHYNEAENVLSRWTKLLATAESLQNRLTEEQKPAAYQLIVHPVKSTYIFIALRIAQARNQLYTLQRRNTANLMAQRALDLFDADFDVQLEFHALLGGKWNHLLQQPHLGYGDSWHAPSRDMITGMGYVQRRQNSTLIVGQMGVSVEGHAGVRPGRINEESERTHPSRRDLVPGLTLGAMTRYGPATRWFDVWTRGTPTIHWTASTPYSWLRLSNYSGILVPGRDDARVEISISWNQVPEDFHEEVLIDVRSAIGDFEQVHLPICGRRVPDGFCRGFVEAAGYVSIPAKSSASVPDYTAMPDNGRSEAGSIGLDIASGVRETANFLTYPFYQFSNITSAKITLEFGITLSTSSEETISYDLQLNNGAVEHHDIEEFTDQSVQYGLKLGIPRAAGWMKAAGDQVWKLKHDLIGLSPGEHVVKIRLCHPNMVLEKLVVDFGGAKESYLGPPPSYLV